MILKKNKPILIVAGEPKSIFFEILFKSLKNNKFISPIILIGSNNLLQSEMKKFKYKKEIRLISFENLRKFKFNNNSINLINVNFDKRKVNIYIKDCFDLAFKILRSEFTYKFINGPVNKYSFLNKKYLGITEYIAQKFNVKKNAMLIYNNNLSVCPVTTHLPLKLVSKSITSELIKEKTILINDFFKINFGFKPNIAVTGLNPHCETILKFSEDNEIITPTVKRLKKNGYKIYGPFPADTVFLKQNRKKFDVIMGMYHDQVLAPIKTLKEYDAINITLGLPFYRISPDHGPNKKMIDKNLSSSLSLLKAIKFLDQR